MRQTLCRLDCRGPPPRRELQSCTPGRRHLRSRPAADTGPCRARLHLTWLAGSLSRRPPPAHAALPADDAGLLRGRAVHGCTTTRSARRALLSSTFEQPSCSYPICSYPCRSCAFTRCRSNMQGGGEYPAQRSPLRTYHFIAYLVRLPAVLQPPARPLAHERCG
jgi:hypothetical protein